MATEKDSAKIDNGLDAAEIKDAIRRTAPSSLVVFEAVRKEGERELERSTPSLAWSALAAGLSMGFSFLAEAFLSARLPDADWTPLISKFGYSVGFVIVILGRQQLFTENTLTPVLHCLHSPAKGALANLARLWAVVLAANLFGSFLFAALIACTEVFTGTPIEGQLLAIATDAAQHSSFSVTFARAMFAGWLIALMIWLLPCAEAARVIVIVGITYLIGLGGFPHIIAGSSEHLYLLLRGEYSSGAFLGQFLAPTLLGNIAGGMAFVSALNYAQVLSERRKPAHKKRIKGASSRPGRPTRRTAPA